MKAFFGTLLLLLISTNLLLAQKGAELPAIFSGTDLAGWKTPDGNAEAGWWTAKDGVLHCKSGPKQKGSVLKTEKKYQDFEMTMEFKFGEGTIDSGVMVRGDKDQIQIGISGSLKRDMTASPYIPGKGYPVEALKDRAEILKKDDWNAIKIRAVGGKYTVWLNGTEVLAYESDTATKEGPIGLQLHGKRNMSIDFRNIRAKSL